jgi:hypothetical protein
MTASPTKIDRKLVAELMAREEKRLEDETPKSHEMFKRASKSLVNEIGRAHV